MQSNISEISSTIADKLNHWLNVLIDSIPNIVMALAVLLTSYYLSKFFSKMIIKLLKNRVSKKSVATVIAKIASTVVVILGLFLALGALNLNETLKSLLTGAGIAGIIIGMALQGTLSNTIAGIILSFRKKIRLGDWVETNSFAGEVIDLNLREFTLKEADNNIVIIPNKTILESPLKNYSLTTKMRVMVECGVGYESDLELVENVTKNSIANAFEQVLDADDVEFYYTSFGDSSINFLCRFWIDAESALEKLRSKSKAIKVIRKAFEKDNINIPFPIRTLKFGNNEKMEHLNEAITMSAD
ncbi:mechanosensitive ion channel family protein [Seonamhaeicola sp. ML3]|uniref:mechanosensitive ion channel family protein n=1 Tax=Seonamhaeicola sp. ML3 TaxID=2937786 RepID=UPI00200BDCCF|nr:mechanosensitive ion channel domain-containing protein [Seonamhaeicola sp. ML3]